MGTYTLTILNNMFKEKYMFETETPEERKKRLDKEANFQTLKEYLGIENE